MFNKQYLLSHANEIPWIIPQYKEREAKGKVSFDEAEKQLPPHLRIHCVKRLESLYIPLAFHQEIEDTIKSMIHTGYNGRKPLTPSNYIKARSPHYFEPIESENLTACGGSLIGLSGMGKSLVVQHILQNFPQVIVAGDSQSVVPLNQLVWLNISCPHDGLMRSLCRSIICQVDEAFDSNYASLLHRQYLGDKLRISTAKLLRVHGLGLLVIDDFENVLNANEREQAEIFMLVIELVNSVGIPVLLLGNPKMFSLIKENFMQDVRGGSDNSVIWNRMELNEDWNFLVKSLLKYQWTNEEAEFSPEIVQRLFSESIGIPAVAIKGYILAQQRAIVRDLPRINADLISAVMRENMQLLQHFIAPVRNETGYINEEMRRLI